MSGAPSGDAPPDEPLVFALRPLLPDDIDRVMAIELASFQTPWPRSAFDLALRASTLLCLAAHTDDDLAGYLIACPFESSVLIANVAVHPEARRRGIGRRLVQRALAWSASLGAERCRLEVRVTNRRAIELYRSLGFRPIAIQTGYYERPAEDALSMVCEIEQTAAD